MNNGKILTTQPGKLRKQHRDEKWSKDNNVTCTSVVLQQSTLWKSPIFPFNSYALSQTLLLNISHCHHCWNMQEKTALAQSGKAQQPQRCWRQLCKALNYRILYGSYDANIYTYSYLYSITLSVFHCRLKPSFSAILTIGLVAQCEPSRYVKLG